MTTDEVKEKLTIAFKEMRKQGFVARQNYLCCMTCGFDGLNTIYQERVAKGKIPKGVVFYHSQDNANLKIDGYVHLAYDGNDDVVKDDSAISQVEAGEMIVEILKHAGLDVEWNGQATQRIKTGIFEPKPVSRSD